MTGSTESEQSASAKTSDDAPAASEPTEATADTGDAGAGAAEPAALKQKPSAAFGGLGPAEAARKRWRDKRAREQDETEASAHRARGEVALVRVTVEVGKVIDKLSTEARGGNVQAARELREWLGKVEAETDTSVSALDRATRQRMKARLLAELDAEQDDPDAPLPDADAHGAEGVEVGDEHAAAPLPL